MPPPFGPLLLPPAPVGLNVTSDPLVLSTVPPGFTVGGGCAWCTDGNWGVPVACVGPACPEGNTEDNGRPKRVGSLYVSPLVPA